MKLRLEEVGARPIWLGPSAAASVCESAELMGEGRSLCDESQAPVAGAGACASRADGSSLDSSSSTGTNEPLP